MSSAFGTLRRDDRELGVALDPVAGVDQLAVHLAGERGARKAGADRRGDFGYGDGSGKRLRRAVGETDVRHCARVLAYYHDESSASPRDQPLRSHARSAPAGHRARRCLELPIEEIFFRFTKFREWDVSEMSFGKIDFADVRRSPPIVALPVFLSRVFRHSAIYVGNSEIRTAKDLEGKRVGIPEWAQTAGIYVRGMLQHEYGVDLAQDPVAPGRRARAGPGREGAAAPAAGREHQPVPERTLADMLATASSTR